MTTLLPLTLILLFSAWLLLRALKIRQNSINNAALLAELEEMDASLNRLELQSLESDRELRRLGIHEDQEQPVSQLTNTPADPRESDQPQAPTISSRSAPATTPRESKNPNPKRKRGINPTPKTREEYEAGRKPLPPSPVYIPNPKALARFDEVYGPFSPRPSSDIRGKLGPSEVENPVSKRPSFFNLCFTPIRIVARSLSAVLTPVLRIQNIFASFFTRPKPPPIAAKLPSERRAA